MRLDGVSTIGVRPKVSPRVAVSATPDPDLAAAEDLARKLFGFPSLRAEQADVLRPILKGRDTLGVIPTGTGKSLCYILPSLMGPGIGVVVSPLIALIRDQVLKLRRAGIPAAAMDSLQTPDERRQVMTALGSRQVKILFVSPERFSLPSFRALLSEQELRILAVDEAHCINQWGHNFRPDYRKLGDYFRDLPRTPLLALTATATKEIQSEIVTVLGMQSAARVIQPPTRKTLTIEIEKSNLLAEQRSKVVRDVLSRTGQGIVYAPTRKDVNEIYDALRAAGESVSRYHAGLVPVEREATFRSFSDGSARIIVATNAFGMGIDKADIRFVHHAGLPQSLEQYVQEIGRAGRDGLTASCRLFFMARDYHVQKFMIEKSHIPAKTLKCAWSAIESKNGTGSGSIDSSELSSTISRAISGTASDAHACIEAFRKEGWLIPQSGDRRPDGGIVSFLVVKQRPADGKEFWKAYPKRKTMALARLSAVYTYAGAGSENLTVLNRYFSD